jgi:chromosome segregation ATPase
MPRKLPRDPKTIGSFAELRQKYSELYDAYDEKSRQLSATSSTLKSRTHEVRGTKADLKKAKSELVTLTKKEHAKAKEKSAAAYASTAATTLIITYQVVEVSGGWGRWAPVFEHEATIGVLQVAIGSLLAWAMRPLS